MTAERPTLFSKDRYYLKTEELSSVGGFTNLVPSFNNIYDVAINFNNNGLVSLLNFIKQHSLVANEDGSDPGDYLALFCSEAVLPGSQIETTSVDGLRQGVTQHYARYRRYPDFSLTFYSQKDYYTQEVFNAWMEYISPTEIGVANHGNLRTQLNERASYKKLKYPDTYKCDIEITAFSNDMLEPVDRQVGGERNPLPRMPNFITYYMQQAFPVNIVAAPLAYGDAELIKTTVSFKYDYYYIERGSRQNDNMTDIVRKYRTQRGVEAGIVGEETLSISPFSKPQ